MQIILKQTEIEEALYDFIVKQGISLRNRSIVINFIAGRTPNGLTADVDISDADAMPDLDLDAQADAPTVEEAPAPKKAKLKPIAVRTPVPEQGKEVSEDLNTTETTETKNSLLAEYRDKVADEEESVFVEVEPKADGDKPEKTTSLFGS